MTPIPLKFFEGEILALFKREISVYSFVDNMTIRHYDYLGLQCVYEIMDCIDRCNKMSKSVPSPKKFLEICIQKCHEDPKHVPTPLSLVTPSMGKPGWSISKPKSNWIKLLTVLKSWKKR